MAQGLHFDASLNTNDFNAKISGMEKNVAHLANLVEQQGNAIQGTFTKLAAGVGSFFTTQQIYAFGQQILSVRDNFQKLEMSFTTMLGSADRAKEIMGQLMETAAKTPFSQSDVTNGAKQLMAYGVQAEEVNDKLIKLGDIAAGMSIPLGDLAMLYGTTMVQGRMFTQDLRQFQGRGIAIAESLADVLGTTKDKIGDLVTAGKVTADVFDEALMKLATDKFSGLMDKQAESIGGRIETIKDNIELAMNEMGKDSEGLIYKGIEGADKSVEFLSKNWKKVGESIAWAVGAFGAYKASLMVIAALEKARQSYENNHILAMEQEAQKKMQAIAQEEEELAILQQQVEARAELLALTKEGTMYQTESIEQPTFNESKDALLQQIEQQKVAMNELISLRGEELKSATDVLAETEKQYQLQQGVIQTKQQELGIDDEALEEIKAKREEIKALYDDASKSELSMEEINDVVPQYEMLIEVEKAETLQSEIEGAAKRKQAADTALSAAMKNKEQLATAGLATAESKEAVAATTASKAKMMWQGAINGVSKAFTALKATIMANPIGFAITAVMAAVSVWQMFKDETESLEEAQKKLLDSIASSADSVRQELAVIDSSLSPYEARRKSLDDIINKLKEHGIASQATVDSLNSEADKLRYVNEHREELIKLIEQEAMVRATADAKAEAYKKLVEEAQNEASDITVAGLNGAETSAMQQAMAQIITAHGSAMAELQAQRASGELNEWQYTKRIKELQQEQEKNVREYGQQIGLTEKQTQNLVSKYQTQIGDMLGKNLWNGNKIKSYANVLQSNNLMLGKFGVTTETASAKYAKMNKQLEDSSKKMKEAKDKIASLTESLKDKNLTKEQKVQLQLNKEGWERELNDAKEKFDNTIKSMEDSNFDIVVQAEVETNQDKYKKDIEGAKEQFEELVEYAKKHPAEFVGDPTEFEAAKDKVMQDIEDINHKKPVTTFGADVTDFFKKATGAKSFIDKFPDSKTLVLNFATTGQTAIDKAVDALNNIIKGINKITGTNMALIDKPKFEATPTPKTPKSSTGDDKKKKKSTSKKDKSDADKKAEEERNAQNTIKRLDQEAEDMRKKYAEATADAIRDYNIAKAKDTFEKQTLEYKKQLDEQKQAATDAAKSEKEAYARNRYERSNAGNKKATPWESLDKDVRDEWIAKIPQDVLTDIANKAVKLEETATVTYEQNMAALASQRLQKEIEAEKQWEAAYQASEDITGQIMQAKIIAEKQIQDLDEQLKASGDNKDVVSSIAAQKKTIIANLQKQVSDLEFKEFQKTIGWENLMNNTSQMSKETLVAVLPKLREMSANTDPKNLEQLKNIADLIKQIEEELEKNTFGKSLESFKEGYGFTRKRDEKTGEKIDGYNFNPLQFAQQFAADFGKATELAFELGLDPESKAGRQLQSAADGLNSAAGAAASFMSGDYVGAVLQSVQAVKSFAKVFSPGNIQEMQKAIDLQNEYMAAYALQMEMAKERITDSSKGVESAFKAVADSAQAYTDSVKSANIGLDAAMKMWDDSHSISKNWGKDVKTDAMAKAYNDKYAKEYGNFNGSKEQFLQMSPEALRALTSLPEWKKFLTEMRGQVDDASYEAFVQAVDAKVQLANQADEAMNEMIARLTGTNFGALVDSYKSAIQKMETTTDDFANYIQEMMNNAIADVIMDESFRERLNALQKYIAEAAENGFDDAEIAYIKAEKKALAEQGKRKQQELKDSGLYEDTSTSQQSSGKGYQSMSEDTGQELNGRFTALQMAGESINATTQQLLAMANVQNTLMTANNRFLSDILTQNSLQTLYLEDIQKDTRKIYSEFSAKLDTMNATLKTI